MVFERLRRFLKVVIDDGVLNLTTLAFKETPDYQTLLTTSTQQALNSAISWLWLVGLSCTLFILAQHHMEHLPNSDAPFRTSIDYLGGLFLLFLLAYGLAMHFTRLRLFVAKLSIKTLAVGFFLLGCYWSLMLTMLEGNQQILFAMSLYLLLAFTSLAGLYVSTLCLYSFVLPVTLIPLVLKFFFSTPSHIFVIMGVVMTLFLLETGRRMLNHWFIQAIRQEYTNQTYAAALDEIAHNDALTGIPNRRQFDDRISKLITLAPLAHTPPTIILIDVDYFKKYNDRYGHLMGDKCLIDLSQALTHTVRNATGDLVARYGGEEFVVVLSDVSLALAQDIASRIQYQITDLAIPHAGSLISDRVTVSQGIAQWQPGESVANLLNRADKALYRSKEAGRNRFTLAD